MEAKVLEKVFIFLEYPKLSIRWRPKTQGDSFFYIFSHHLVMEFTEGSIVHIKDQSNTLQNPMGGVLS
jgi:hypothetical protein